MLICYLLFVICYYKWNLSTNNIVLHKYENLQLFIPHKHNIYYQYSIQTPVKLK